MITQLDELADIRNQHKNEKIVLTSGTFDLLHVGHIRYLGAVKSFGDILIVMMSGNNRVRARKGPDRPIIAEQDRAVILDSLKLVDYVFIDPATSLPHEVDPIHAEIVDKLQPDLYVTDGEDPRFWDIMDASRLKVVGRTNEDTSTTAIIQRIQNLT